MTAAEQRGLLLGLLAVASFSVTLPATRLAVGPLGISFVAMGRAIGAGLLAALILWAMRQPWPDRKDWLGLIVTSLGVVIGFPFLTTFAMANVEASHGAIVVGLLPLTTAVVGTLITGERPSLGFWLVSCLGTAILLAFILQRAKGSISMADAALVGAVVSAAVGYAKGGQIAVRLGGWQVICWALVFSLPFLLVLAPFTMTLPTGQGSAAAWLAFAYVTVVSQLTGFFAWYYALAVGGVARVSQVQLLQLFMSLIVSSVLLGETIDARMVSYAIAVVATVAIGTRLRVKRG